MRLYFLKRKDPDDWFYDEAMGFVVRAKSHRAAREIASKKGNHGDEGGKFWLDVNLSTCSELHPEGAEGVILRDFMAGA